MPVTGLRWQIAKPATADNHGTGVYIGIQRTVLSTARIQRVTSFIAHHEIAVSTIGNCKSSKEKFTAAVKE